MFTRTVSDELLELLDLLQPIVENSFYLAGGTAAALHLGHRKSEDLDFFSAKEFEPISLHRELSSLQNFNFTGEARGTLHGIINGVKLSFFHYPYPVLYDFIDYKNIDLADLKDIALMKLTAISGRGARKDFIDLFFIATKIMPLEKMLQIFSDKYANKEDFRYHLVKSLGYFEDADRDPMPIMFEDISWIKIKEYFQKEQHRLFEYFFQDKK